MNISSLTNLIPGVSQLKLIGATVAGVIVLSGAAYVVWEIHEVKALSEQVTVLKQNQVTLKNNANTAIANYNTCKSANDVNSQTIKSLEAERQDAVTSVNVLAGKTQSDARTISDLKAKFDSMNKDPKNNGSLSPDLREAIRGIQASGRN